MRKLFSCIKISPQEAIHYLRLSCFYLHEGNSRAAQKSLKTAMKYCFKESDVSVFFLELEQKTLLMLLNLASVTTHIAEQTQEIRGFRIFIHALLEETGKTKVLNPALLPMLGYFQNILGRYKNGQETIEHCIQHGGNNLMLSRTLTESLLGMWDLEPNPNSGVDLSILKDFKKFSQDSEQEFLESLKVSRSCPNYTQSVDAIVFLSSDGNYFDKFGIAQALSLLEVSPNFGIHFHVMNPSDKSKSFLKHLGLVCPQLHFSFSFEDVVYADSGSWARKTYYASARFCRAADFAFSVNKPVVVTDADILFRKDISNLVWESPGKLNYDIALFVPYTKFLLTPLYAKFCASFVAISPSALGKTYMSHIKYFIEENLKKRRACWTLDQFALLAVSEAHVRNQISTKLLELPFEEMLNMEHINQEEMRSATVWTSASENKFGVNRYTQQVRRLLERYGFDRI